MYEEYIREVKNPEQLIGEDVGFCFVDFTGCERADSIIIKEYKDGVFIGTDSYLEEVVVKPEQMRRYYHIVHSMTEMLNTSTTC